jgi:urease accessory protein
VVRAFALAEAGKLVHLHNVSGGVLAGDRLALDVEVEAGAATQLTTTGATRLYRHRAGAADSLQCATFTVRDGAILEFLPDPVIPYAASRHTQRTEIRLGRKATLLWWEVLAPGRLAAGERFAFEMLRVKASIHAAERPVFLEDYTLDPVHQDLTSPVRMLGYSHMASLYAVQEGRPPEFWRSLEHRLNEIAAAQTSPGRAMWGASALASDGLLVRGLTASGRFVYEPLVEFWQAARVALTGHECPLPRKIY